MKGRHARPDPVGRGRSAAVRHGSVGRVTLWLGLVLLVLFNGVATAAAQPTGAAAGADGSGGRGWSADLPVVSDGRHLWLGVADTQPSAVGREPRPLSPGDQLPVPMTALYHADLRPPASDEAPGPTWEAVTRLRGELAEHGIAAHDRRLYLIFRDGQVRMLALRPAQVPGDWFFSTTALRRLPPDTTLRAAVAAQNRLWALVRVDSAQTLQQLDAPRDTSSEVGPDDKPDSAEAAQSERRRNLVLGLPLSPPGNDQQDAETSQLEASPDGNEPPGPDDPRDPTDDVAGPPPANGPDAGTDNSAEARLDWPSERLLVLERDGWRAVPLPGDWPAQLPVALAEPATPGGRPVLIAKRPAPGGDPDDAAHQRLDLYEPFGEPPSADRDDRTDVPNNEADTEAAGWTKLTLPIRRDQETVVRRVGGQLVLVTAAYGQEKLTAELSAIRGQRLLPLGNLELDGSSLGIDLGRWSAVAAGETVAWMAGGHGLGRRLLELTQDPAGELSPGPTLQRMDLRGKVQGPAHTMGFEPRDLLAEVGDTVILMGVVLMSTVLLLTFWRRDPSTNVLELPLGATLADPLRRGLAGLIDLAPGLLLATLGFGLNLEELYQRWPGRGIGATFRAMMPGLAMIAVTLLHTTAVELITARSMGKWLTGLRVCDLGGNRPRAWQLLIRNLLRLFDLVAYLLLVLPLISPYRQRLGDMVARTVVVMRSPEPEGDAAPALDRAEADADNKTKADADTDTDTDTTPAPDAADPPPDRESKDG